MNKPVIIAVAGGSSSGKTTVVNKILDHLKDYNIVVIRHDDYYKDQSDMTLEERKLVNYDHPFSLDNDLFYEHIVSLIEVKSINKPTYDFVNKNKEKPATIIILEGILVLEDDRFRDLADIKLFVEADEELRFIRRLKRDMVERGRTMESVINHYLETVKPMHYAFVKPTKRYADIIIPNDYQHDVAVDLISAKIIAILNK